MCKKWRKNTPILNGCSYCNSGFFFRGNKNWFLMEIWGNLGFFLALSWLDNLRVCDKSDCLCNFCRVQLGNCNCSEINKPHRINQKYRFLFGVCHAHKCVTEWPEFCDVLSWVYSSLLPNNSALFVTQIRIRRCVCIDRQLVWTFPAFPVRTWTNYGGSRVWPTCWLEKWKLLKKQVIH